MEKFEVTDIESLQFCICFKTGKQPKAKAVLPPPAAQEASKPSKQDEISTVPVADGVQEALKEIVVETMKEWESMDGGWVRFEYAEQYPIKAKLRADYSIDEFDKIRHLYTFQNPPLETNLFDDKYEISYYLVVYNLKSGKRVVGVRQARGLKALLAARNRIVQIMDDSLTTLDRDVLKLDNAFDFVIDEQFVYILHSSGFESIAQVDEKILDRAKEKALELQQRIAFVDFTGIADHAAKHKRSARLVAAVWSRKNLDTLSATKVKRFARHTEVEFIETNGVIKPLDGHEAGLLEAIDYRRYRVDIDTDGAKVFIALSRKRAQRPPKAKQEPSEKAKGKKTKPRTKA